MNDIKDSFSPNQDPSQLPVTSIAAPVVINPPFIPPIPPEQNIYLPPNSDNKKKVWIIFIILILLILGILFALFINNEKQPKSAPTTKSGLDTAELSGSPSSSTPSQSQKIISECNQ